MRRLATEQILTRFREAHGDHYDYSQVCYQADGVPVTIICPDHGPFRQDPRLHWEGAHCGKCADRDFSRERIRKGAMEFERRAKKTHGDLYDYTSAVFTGAREKLIIICRVHGPFQQQASEHLHGSGCPQCANEAKNQDLRLACRDSFVARARKIHGNRYDYQRTDYQTSDAKVTLICSIHGEFYQKPSSHLAGHGCDQCAAEERAEQRALPGKERFLLSALAVHGDRYDYSKAKYVRSRTKVTIVCRQHGPFEQTPENHLRGPNGCPKCAHAVRAEKRRMSQEEFLGRAIEIHGNKYDYARVDYRNWDQPVIILCPHHGEFRQSPNAHLAGKGCAICNESTGEREIARYLLDAKIAHLRQYVVEPRPHPYRYDFYVPSHNLLIEFHGTQHYEPSEFFGGQIAFRHTQIRDQKKKSLAERQGFQLLIIPHSHFDRIHEILSARLGII